MNAASGNFQGLLAAQAQGQAVATLVPTKSDVEVARDLRIKIETAIEPLCRLMDEARSLGLTPTFSIGPDYLGRHIITSLKIVKEL